MIPITDEQYETLKSQLSGADERLAEIQKNYEGKGYSPEQVDRLMDTSGRTRIAMDREDLEIYEQLKQGKLPESFAFDKLGYMLICMRIASGLSQAALASRLEIPEATLAANERNEHHGITFRNAQKIVEALGAKVTLSVGL